ncbi:hypothetical protein GTP38_05085 [Duganella sp. FT94W]|uniref:Uncharacterized protein n=1 Tax=Duganella lactea TaxID=2692173 RepID=A0ABW9V4L9_9BURK|nr:hypothetical protein [Duganella lactea]MYM33712.1 hypothetical protein [Duganella lactea]
MQLAVLQVAGRDPAMMPKKPQPLLPLPSLRPYYFGGFEEMNMVWVDSKILEKMWSLNSAYYIRISNPEPKDEWFSHANSTDDRYGIIVPIISLETVEQRDSIFFTNGRHRTRWLIDSGFSEIVVAMGSSQIPKAMSLGLVTRNVVDGDRLSL